MFFIFLGAVSGNIRIIIYIGYNEGLENFSIILAVKFNCKTKENFKNLSKIFPKFVKTKE